MSCELHIFCEVRNKKTGKWKQVGKHFPVLSCKNGMYKTRHPFDWQSYSLFGFLADVRNYSGCTPISQPKGIPNNISHTISKEWEEWRTTEGHSDSFLTLRELLEFNYNKKFIDDRFGEDTYGKRITHKEHLGKRFFVHLKELKKLGKPDDVRIVFWFDN